MPDIKIRVGGSSGTVYTLPALNSIGGAVSPPVIPYSPQVERKTMPDGSRRWIHLPRKRTWPLSWAMLSLTQFETLITLADQVNTVEILDGWTDASTWYPCKITTLTGAPRTDMYSADPGTIWYAATMIIEEQ